MKFNKIISAVLVGTMVLGMAACGDNAATSTNTSSEVSTESVVASETTATETEPEVYEVTYPVDTDVTFTYWGAYPREFTVENIGDPYYVGLEANTGIKLEPEIVATGDMATSYNLLLTEEELPDIITHNFASGALEMLYEDGAIWDLTPYLEEYAPDYWAYLNAEGNENILKASKTSDGKILAVGAYLESEFNGTYIGPVIRQDWLDECGLKAPVTLEDWEAVLVAFNEKYGAKLAFASNRYNVGIASGTGAYAGYAGDKLYVDDNGKVQFAAVQPEWKEMIEILNKWNEMGLVDQDSFSMGDKDIRQKVAEGKVGISITAMSQLTNWIADAEAENGSGANWVGLAYPRTEAGASTSMIQAAALSSAFKTAVSTSVTEEELKYALAWMNYGFTEEGFMYQNFGTEGVSYTVDASGTISYTDAVKGSTLSEFISDYVGTTNNAICGIQAADMVRLKNNPAAGEAVYTWIDNTEALDHLLPTLSIPDADSTTYSDKMTLIQSYAKEMGLKFILGDADIANFDAFVAEIEKMGLQECLDIQQKAYDEFLAR